MNVLLISTYELGHQPLGLAGPAAWLTAAGHDVACLDLSVEPFDEAAVARADFVGISVPMHTATRLGVVAAERVRRINPRGHVCFYGLYAALHADVLLGRFADSVIGGEYEGPLVTRVGAWESGRVGDEAPSPTLHLGRQQFPVPRRDLLPPLARYSRLDDGSRQKQAGYVEASRGCAHRCLHCPITPVYGGRLRIVQSDVVLEDIRQLVRLGAEHITFGDPDFFNGIRHSLRIVEALHAEFPELSYDVTIKVEHLLEHRAKLPLLKATGCAFVVSAVEAVDDMVLANLNKGHSAADVEIALGLTAAAGLVLRPTFVAFTPWTSLEGYLGLLAFLERHRLIGHVDPVQLTIRLLVPRGSSLVGTAGMDPYLGPFDPTGFTHTWAHPDPRVDGLQRRVAGLVERAVRDGEDAVDIFYRVKAAALELAGRSADLTRPAELAAVGPVPRLTEPWFC